MDRATLLGLLLAFGGVLVGILLEGGSLRAMVSLSSFFIVIVGSIGAMVLSFGIHDAMRFPRCIATLVRGKVHDWEGAIVRMVELATMARRNGVLALESQIKEEKDEFMRAGLRMMVDGADNDVLEDVLEARVEVHQHVGRQDEKLFEVLGGYMPTMGIVGTVTSLIHVLGNLSEPNKLGAGIAAAFTATLYGVGIANMAVLPVASKMRCLAEDEVAYYRMLQTGLVAVQSGDNPLWVEQKMRAHIPAHAVLSKVGTRKAKAGAKAKAKTAAA